MVHWIELFYEKRDILKMSFMFKTRNGIWLYDNERKGKCCREKSFYDNFQLFKHCFNQSLIHTHTHIYTIYDGYIVSKNRQNLSEMMCQVLHKGYDFNFQRLTQLP